VLDLLIGDRLWKPHDEATRLLVRDSGTPDAETEGQLVDQIRDVVSDVDNALLVVGGGGAQQSEVVSQRVDGPSDGDDEAHAVESGKACLVSASLGQL